MQMQMQMQGKVIADPWLLATPALAAVTRQPRG